MMAKVAVVVSVTVEVPEKTAAVTIGSSPLMGVAVTAVAAIGLMLRSGYRLQ